MQRAAEPASSKEDSHGRIDVLFADSRMVEQRYERNSAILVTRFEDDAGNAIEVTDFAPRFRLHGRMFSPSMLVRIVRRTAGRPRIALRVRPSVDYGRARAETRCGAHHISYVGSAQSMRLTTDAAVSAITDEKPFFLQDSVTLLMGPDETVDGSPRESAAPSTSRRWTTGSNWVRNLAIPFEWQDVTIRAAITLKLNAFDDTGAVIAAVTTSIPEAPHSRRNWDYRFCWLRDAYFVVNALNSLGATGTMERYLDYILNIIADTATRRCSRCMASGARWRWKSARTAPGRLSRHGAGAGRQLGLFPGAERRVRRGGAGQHPCLLRHAAGAPAGHQMFQDLERLGEQAVLNYNVPDAGIWELRGAEAGTYLFQHDVLGRLRPPGTIAGRLGLNERADYWSGHAQEIHRVICDVGMERGTGQLRLDLRRRPARRQPAADGRVPVPGARRSAFRRHRAGHRENI